MSLDGFTCAGPVGYRALNLPSPDPPVGRLRHRFGDGPFARLVMPRLPQEPGLYIWQRDETVVYIGQTRMPLAARLGANGYSTISRYNTLARELGKTNGGQQTNCRINMLANAALAAGSSLVIWYRVTDPFRAAAEEAAWCRASASPSGTAASNGSAWWGASKPGSTVS